MRNYYTLGDSRYLPHLICLIDSINENFKDDRKIHVLALDNEVFEFFSKKKRPNVVVYSSDEVMSDFDIRAIRYLPPGQEARSNASASGKDPGFVQFCWALAPCFGEWLMNRLRDSVTYIDADIMFFNDISPFFEELGKNSIGFVSHRIPYLYSSGEYNVGVVHFSFDGPGRSAIRRWKSFLSNPNNQYSTCFGVCGDQKYLEVIDYVYNQHVKVVDDNFGHLAPWNVTNHRYKDGKIVWKGKQQDLIYFHFAHFVIDDNGNYRASYNNEWTSGDPLKVDEFVNSAYNSYYNKMILAKREIKS